MRKNFLKLVIEFLLFVSGEFLSLNDLVNYFEEKFKFIEIFI